MNAEGKKDVPPKKIEEEVDPLAAKVTGAVGAFNYTTDEKDEGTGEEWVLGPDGKLIRRPKGGA